MVANHCAECTLEGHWRGALGGGLASTCRRPQAAWPVTSVGRCCAVRRMADLEAKVSRGKGIRLYCALRIRTLDAWLRFHSGELNTIPPLALDSRHRLSQTDLRPQQSLITAGNILTWHSPSNYRAGSTFRVQKKQRVPLGTNVNQETSLPFTWALPKTFARRSPVGSKLSTSSG